MLPRLFFWLYWGAMLPLCWGATDSASLLQRAKTQAILFHDYGAQTSHQILQALAKLYTWLNNPKSPDPFTPSLGVINTQEALENLQSILSDPENPCVIALDLQRKELKPLLSNAQSYKILLIELVKKGKSIKKEDFSSLNEVTRYLISYSSRHHLAQLFKANQVLLFRSAKEVDPGSPEMQTFVKVKLRLASLLFFDQIWPNLLNQNQKNRIGKLLDNISSLEKYKKEKEPLLLDPQAWQTNIFEALKAFHLKPLNGTPLLIPMEWGSPDNDSESTFLSKVTLQNAIRTNNFLSFYCDPLKGVASSSLYGKGALLGPQENMRFQMPGWSQDLLNNMRLREYELSPEYDVFYHGANHTLLFNYTLLEIIQQYLQHNAVTGLRVQPNDPNAQNIDMFLDAYYKNHANRKQFDYAQKDAERLTAASITLHNLATESAVDFFKRNNTWLEGSLNSNLLSTILEGNLQALGLDPQIYKDFHQQRFQDTQIQGGYPNLRLAPKLPVMMQIFIRKDKVDNMVYLSGAYGVPVVSNGDIHITSSAYDQTQRFKETHKFLQGLCDNTPCSFFSKKYEAFQIRILTHNPGYFDPNITKMFFHIGGGRLGETFYQAWRKELEDIVASDVIQTIITKARTSNQTVQQYVKANPHFYKVGNILELFKQKGLLNEKYHPTGKAPTLHQPSPRSNLTLKVVSNVPALQNMSSQHIILQLKADEDWQKSTRTAQEKAEEFLQSYFMAVACNKKLLKSREIWSQEIRSLMPPLLYQPPKTGKTTQLQLWPLSVVEIIDIYTSILRTIQSIKNSIPNSDIYQNADMIIGNIEDVLFDWVKGDPGGVDKRSANLVEGRVMLQALNNYVKWLIESNVISVPHEQRVSTLNTLLQQIEQKLSHPTQPPHHEDNPMAKEHISRVYLHTLAFIEDYCIGYLTQEELTTALNESQSRYATSHQSWLAKDWKNGWQSIREFKDWYGGYFEPLKRTIGKSLVVAVGG